MDIDFGIVLAGAIVGFTVGLTGMGGGALMTPILILFFGIDPVTAVSSDLVVSLLMKPVGAAVHLRKGTVNLKLVKWLIIGSVPAAVIGVLLITGLRDNDTVNPDTVDLIIKTALGIALLLSVATMIGKATVSLRQHYRDQSAGIIGQTGDSVLGITVRPVPTLIIGVLGGVVVGMTSVGSGSLIIVGLLLAYPTLRAGGLVGTDLVQAVPLVGAAALTYILVGEFHAPPAWAVVDDRRQQRAEAIRPKAEVHQRGIGAPHDSARRTHVDASLVALPCHLDRQEARATFLHQLSATRRHEAELEHRMRRADTRVPGKGQFPARREDAQPVVGARLARRQHESCLGEIQPGGDRLHGSGIEVAGVRHDRKRVAAAGRVGEDVELEESALLHGWSATARSMPPRPSARACRCSRP